MAGSLQSRSYKNKDGENRVAYTVSANRVFFAPQTKEDAKDDAEDQGAIVDTASQAAPAYPQTAQAYEIPDDYYVDENAEDLPF